MVTKPDAHARVRPKRSSRNRAAVDDGTLPKDPSDVNGPSSLNKLREALEQSEHERERTVNLLVRAEEDLDTAHQRLLDADAARRHLLENVASGGDEARRRFASVLHDDVLQH